MATKTHFQLLLLLLFSLCNLSIQSFSLNPERKIDYYERWLSWNEQNYRIKSSKSIMQARDDNGGGRNNNVDVKLRNAEMNIVRISVNQNGSGDYLTINEALHSIPLYNSRRVILNIKPGVYREKINVPKSMAFITFLGDPSDPPNITGNDTAMVTGRDGKPLNTFQSATVAVDANYFVAINIRFEGDTVQVVINGTHILINTAPHEIGSKKGQAVALRISGTKAAFYNCSFYGTQDTLYDHKGLHYFNNCFIQGSVDFIFGYGRSLYENCNLNSISKKVASVTAQKRNKSSMESGFSFKNSVVTGSGTVYLRRAWGDYSRVVFSYTYMDKLVLRQGWSDWGNHNRDSVVYYGEYKCSGPGANLTGRVPWARFLTDDEAKPFIGTYYVDGDTWLISP